MDTERARELLPWLLNGSLEEPERGELIAALHGDEELRRDLAETRAAGEIFARHLSAEDLVAHVFGAPTELSVARIEAHLALCERCAEELALTRESRSLEQAPQGAEGARPDVLPFRRPAAATVGAGAWRALALAASLLAMVGLGGWLVTWNASQERVADLAASLRDSVPPAQSRALTDGGTLGLRPLDEALRGQQGPRLAPGGTFAAHELIVYPPESEVEDAVAAVWELRLVDADGQELIRAQQAPVMPGDSHLVFRVPALPPGDHVAELRRLDPHRGWVLIERYAVPVGSPD